MMSYELKRTAKRIGLMKVVNTKKKLINKFKLILMTNTMGRTYAFCFVFICYVYRFAEYL